MMKPTFATCGSTKNNVKKTQVAEKCTNSITSLVLGKVHQLKLPFLN